ncbi:MAG: DUF4886 domain-containing protein [Hellea sp.]
MKLIVTAFFMASFLSACAATPNLAEQGPDTEFNYSGHLQPNVKRLRKHSPTHLLFVGNSYLYYGDSVHNHLRRLVEAGGVHEGSTLKYKSATIGGAAIFDHNIDHLLKPESLRVDKPFEAVILQGGSAAPLSDKRRRQFTQTIAEYSKKIEASGGETILYMTPAYVKPHARFRPDMIEDIASLYIAAANDNDALVIPVGLAFEEAYRRRPNMQLHKSFDGSHPSLAGTYLAAATVYASLYGVSPVGNSYDYYGAIDPDTALFLQNVAQDTVKAFFDR